jgi:hypothetical protein
VNDGGILSNTDGYAILAHLEVGQEPGGTVAQTVAAGGSTYDYSCWYAPEFGPDCGIFQVGSTQRVASLQGNPENAPLLLSQILTNHPNCTIYWVCCREVTVTAVDRLTNMPGAFPSGRPPELRAALHAGVDGFFDSYDRTKRHPSRDHASPSSPVRSSPPIGEPPPARKTR